MARDVDDELVRLLKQIKDHVAALHERKPSHERTFLTVDEVADELLLSRDTVGRLIAAGKLRATAFTAAGIGRRRIYRVHRQWVEEFVRNAANAAAPGGTAGGRRRTHAHPTFPDFIKDD